MRFATTPPCFTVLVATIAMEKLSIRSRFVSSDSATQTQPMKNRLPLLAFVALVAFGSSLARADVKLPAIFGDHMVLQRDANVPVWGWAEPGEEVTVSVAGQTKSTKAGTDGKWMVKLANLKSDGATTLVVKGRNTITINDVLIGEVWLGSGQSNMAMAVNRAKDYEQEQAAAKLPLVRMFKEESGPADSAQAEGKGRWVVCAPDTVGTFSATLYFFGREVHQSLGVPVGLINSSVGGTPIESWIAPEAQRASKQLKSFFESAEKENAEIASADAVQRYERALAKWTEDAKKARAEKKTAPRKPQNPAEVAARKGNVGGLFNGKIAPLIPYAIRGALWYQGEANSTPAKAPFYEAQLKLLVTDWRARWGYEFPFAWAQLPNFGGAGRDWPTVREAMLKTLALPKTGMGINIDIGDEKDIHPKNKQEVGRRLSLWALGTVYGKKVPATSGPLPDGHKVRGNEITLSFKHTDGGLVAKDGELKGFVIAGGDKQWKPATVRIEKDKVIVSSPDVKKPVAVRYAWENFPTCNLYNGAGLPATPFRTDDWK
jgi:sialate O-acetylesterase